MELVTSTSEHAVVSLSRSEVLALRNVSEQARLLPLEIRGPHEIFGRLAEHFGALASAMTVGEWATGRFTDEEPTDIGTRDQFGEFVHRVLLEFDSAGRSEWENNTLQRFLDGLAAFALARDHVRPGDEQEQASWKLFAELIVAATGYE